MSKPKRAQHELPITLAMCAPAVRMVAVEAVADEEGGEWIATHRIHPVLAIMARQSHGYFREALPDGRKPAVKATPDGMESQGWHYESIQLMPEFDVLIFDDEYGICDLGYLNDTVNVAYLPAACPWPPEEDETRLADLIEKAKAEAIKKAQRRSEP